MAAQAPNTKPNNPKISLDDIGSFGRNFGLGVAMNVGVNMLSGQSFGQALKQGVTKDLAWDAVMTVVPALGWGMFAFNAARGLTQAYFAAEKRLGEKYKSRRDPNNMNFAYTDTQQALTMRQAAVQAIQGSKLNARSALGGEAKLMHRGLPNRWG